MGGHFRVVSNGVFTLYKIKTYCDHWRFWLAHFAEHPNALRFYHFHQNGNVHHRTAQAVWRWLALNVQHHQIAFGNRTLDV